ncbi:DNA primase [bacterium]|nr:MAG: DNA primase [bacterium]
MALDSVTEEIKKRADLVEIVGQYVALRPAGNDRWKACCPFHDEKTPSFYVSRDKGFYKCFGCLDANELIWTRAGLKAIGEVKEGDEVWNHVGGWSKVAAAWHKTGQLLEVKTSSFRRDPLRLTPEHRCLLVREEQAWRALRFLYRSEERGRLRWKSRPETTRHDEITLEEARADELRVGDFWLFPVVPDSERTVGPLRDESCLAPYVIGKRVTRVEEMPVNAETAFLFGLYLAEGSTNPRSVRWTFHHDEKELALEVVRVLEIHFGLSAAQHLFPQHTTREVICSKTDLARQFERWFGKGAGSKRLPAEALNWPIEIQRALLQGYLCGDGSKQGIAVTVSRELAYGLFALSIQCRMLASLSAQSAYIDPKGQAHRACWFWNARTRPGVNGFFHPIDGTLYYWSRITDITPTEGEHAVVDLTVPGAHSFMTKLGATHNCGKSGDVFRFLMDSENMTFPEARKSLASRFGIALPERRDMTPEQRAEQSERERLLKIAASAQKFFAGQFAGNSGLVARDYARKRGLSRETVEKFGLGYAPDAWESLRSNLRRREGFSDDEGISAGLFIERKSVEGELGGMFSEGATRRVWDRYRHRLMFPIWDESGRVIAFGGRALEGGQTGNPDAKYINSPETPLFHKSNVLFAWHLARGEVAKRGGILISEGYMDAIALHEAGFPHTVATLGTALTANHVSALRRVAPQAVWLCFDGDSAGMKAALRTAPLFADAGLNVRVVQFPDKHDPDTFIRAVGREGMQEELDRSIPLSKYRLEAVMAAHQLSDPHARSVALREAAEIINDISDEIERDSYVSFLVDSLLSLERGISYAEREKRRMRVEGMVRSELNADQTRQGRQDRVRAARSPQGQGAFSPQPSSSGGSLQHVADEARIGTQSVETEIGKVRPRFVSPRQQQKIDEQEKAATDLREAATRTMSSGIAIGVVKAERALLAVLLTQPTWRKFVLEKLPLAKWTSELHAEIVVAAREWIGDDIDPSQFTDGLSREGQGLVAELFLGDEAAQVPEANVVTGWVRRVEMHHAQNAEREMMEMIKEKIARGESVTEEEKEQFFSSLKATKRKAPLEKK